MKPYDHKLEVYFKEGQSKLAFIKEINGILLRQVTGKYERKVLTGGHYGQDLKGYGIYFEKKSDAVMFKLAWNPEVQS